MARLIPDLSEGISSFTSSLSAINTVIETSAKFDDHPDDSFFINTFHIQNHLCRKGVIGHHHTTSQRLAMSNFPGQYGGILISNYASHFIRGIDDQATLWMSIFRTIMELRPEVFVHLNSWINLTQERPVSNQDKVNLCMDIFALRTQRLPLIETRIARIIAEQLPHIIQNPTMKKLFDTKISIPIEELCDSLYSMEPLNLSFSHEVLESSNAGIVRNLQSKFVAMTSVTKMVGFMRDRGVDLKTQKYEDENGIIDEDMLPEFDFEIDEDMIKRPTKIYEGSFLSQSEALTKYVVQLLFEYLEGKRKFSGTLKPMLESEHCSVLLLTKLREAHWGKKLVGVTQTVPMEQYIMYNMDELPENLIGSHITVTVSEVLRQLTSMEDYELGPFTAYIGSITRVIVERPALILLNPSGIVKATQKLATLRTWNEVRESPTLQILLNNLLEEKVNLIPRELRGIPFEDWSSRITGGSIDHRLQGSAESRAAMINHLPSFNSHVKCDTASQNIEKEGRTILFSSNKDSCILYKE